MEHRRGWQANTGNSVMTMSHLSLSLTDDTRQCLAFVVQMMFSVLALLSMFSWSRKLGQLPDNRICVN